MKVFLGDLVHSWGKTGLWTFPLNIAYVASYADKHLLEAPVEFQLFKDPERMIEAIKSERPDVVCLSYYVWNLNLNARVFEIAKAGNPGLLTVGGGPRFTNINATPEGAERFRATQPDCDAYVLNQGERGFLEVLRRFAAADSALDGFFAAPLAGSILFPKAPVGVPLIGDTLDPLKDLDEIPSPYLSGMLDEFFDGPYVPIIETNRSCPYRCTFCAWGIGTQKLSKFSDTRVLAEIDYIARRCTKTTNFYIGDANFGILERDAVIAAKLRLCHEKLNYPGHVAAQWNKTRPDRVLETARVLGEISEVGASMQSLNPATLDAIKRKNLPLEAVVGVVQKLQADGVRMPLFTELILGLPEETRATHIDANKKMIDLGAEVFNYNLHLLPGTEMDTDASRAAYFHRTGWRLHDNCYGIYDGKKVFEGQEVVLETSTMSMEELRSFRFIHFLIQFMWGRRWFFDLMSLFRLRGIHPVDVALAVAEAAKEDSGKIGELYAEFSADHELENFRSFGELESYWSDDENFERLKSGSYGKLNYVFTFKILLECFDEFNALLRRVAREMVAHLPAAEREHFMEQCEDVLRFVGALRISISDDLNLVDTKFLRFSYDILPWRSDGYRGELAKAGRDEELVYKFYLPPVQKRLLETQIKQFHSQNLNQVLRQMSVDTSPDQFFYSVEPEAAGASRH